MKRQLHESQNTSGFQHDSFNTRTKSAFMKRKAEKSSEVIDRLHNSKIIIDSYLKPMQDNLRKAAKTKSIFTLQWQVNDNVLSCWSGLDPRTVKTSKRSLPGQYPTVRWNSWQPKTDQERVNIVKGKRKVWIKIGKRNRGQETSESKSSYFHTHHKNDRSGNSRSMKLKKLIGNINFM